MTYINDTESNIGVLADSYSESNVDNYSNINNDIVGQRFTGVSSLLGRVKFYLKKTGSPTGTAVAKLYAYPSVSALITSETFDVSTLTTSPQLITFNFPTGYQLVSSTDYIVSLEYSDGSVGNTLDVGVDESSPTYNGGAYVLLIGSWVEDVGLTGKTYAFYLYSGYYSFDTETAYVLGADISQGEPIGLLLSLTYANSMLLDGFLTDSEVSNSSYTLDTKN